MADQNAGSNDCDEAQAATEAADRLMSRIEDDAKRGLKPGSDAVEAVGDIVEELETSPEADEVHKASRSNRERWKSPPAEPRGR